MGRKRKWGKKISSYQKLKNENQRLRMDIYILVNKMGLSEERILRKEYRVKFNTLDIARFVDPMSIEISKHIDYE